MQACNEEIHGAIWSALYTHLQQGLLAGKFFSATFAKPDLSRALRFTLGFIGQVLLSAYLQEKALNHLFRHPA